MKHIYTFLSAALIGASFALAPTIQAQETASSLSSDPQFEQGFTLSHSGVQGMDTWGNYLVSLQNYGTCNVYRINSRTSATKLSTFRLASYNSSQTQYNHANVAAFSNQFYDSSDKLPLLYVTRCNGYTDEDKMKSVCYVERLDIDKGTSTLVQKISYDAMSYPVVLWTIDRQNNYLYAFSNSLGAGKEGNKHYLRKFAIPEVGPGKPTIVKLTDADALESYYLEDTYSGSFNAVTQGGAIHNGLFYIPCGFDTPDEPNVLYIWDLKNRKMDKELDMTGTFAGEFEDCSVNYDGWVVYQCNSNHIYFMSPEDAAGDWKNFILNRGVTYRISSDSTAQVTGWARANADVVIPSYVSDAGKTYKVTSIADRAFYNATHLVSITFPSTLTSIGNNAFYNCSKLAKITSKITNPAQCPLNGLSYSQRYSIALTVPSGCAQIYKSTSGWKSFRNITANSVVLDVNFTSSGIHKRVGSSTNTVGTLGEAVVQASGDGSYYLGSSKLQTTDGNTSSYNGKSAFYVTYNGSDQVGQALQDEFTIETLFRLDKTASAAYSSTDNTWSHANTLKILGSQGGGGFSLMHNVTDKTANADGTYSLKGLSTEYIYKYLYSTSKWGKYNHVYSNYYLHPGQFYHVAIAINANTHTEKIYVNGKLVTSAQLDGAGPFIYPNCGTSRRRTQMFFILGGDAASEDTPTTVENPNATTFSYFKVYNSALSDDCIAQIYDTSGVKAFTEPDVDDRLLDVQFSKNGGFADASVYHTLDKPSDATITTQFNSDQKRYEMVCDGTNTNFLRRPYYYDPAFTRALKDGYSIELYAKVPSGNRPRIICGLSGQQAGGGPGLEVWNTGAVKFNANAYGCSGPTSYVYSQGSANFNVTDKFDTDRYIHYVTVFEPHPDTMKVGNTTATLYIDGQRAAYRSLNGNEVTDLPFAQWQWFAVGGDANASNGSSTCDYPWTGDISIARIWGKPLSASDVSLLYSQTADPTTTINISSIGYATTCLPYTALIPEGVTAYIAVAQDVTTVTLQKYAEAGQAIPYATPVILKADPGNYTLEAVASDALSVIDEPDGNLLHGTLASKSVTEDYAYVLAEVNGSGKMCLTAAGLSIPANHAYLLNSGGDSTSKSFIIGPSAIKDTPTVQRHQGTYYDLSGRKVSHPTRGIYILDGRKIFVK